MVWIDDDLEDVPYFAEKGILLEGWKRYEITNHLGNVLAVMNDRKTPKDTDSDGVADYYLPTILSASDYYPFGLQMPGRTQNSPDYRYGFNGKEKDEDGEMGSLTTYDYGFRIYNPGIGKFLSVDPLTKSYPMLTPYQFASNRPIDGIDLDGLEWQGSTAWTMIFNEMEERGETIYGRTLGDWQHRATNEDKFDMFIEAVLVDLPLAFGAAYMEVEGLLPLRSSGKGTSSLFTKTFNSFKNSVKSKLKTTNFVEAPAMGAARRGFTGNSVDAIIGRGTDEVNVARGGEHLKFTEKEGVYIHFFQKHNPWMSPPDQPLFPYVGKSGDSKIKLGERAFNSLQELLGNKKGAKATAKKRGLYYSNKSTFILLEDTPFKNAGDLEYYILSNWGGAGSKSNLNIQTLSPSSDWPSEVPLPKTN